MLGSIGAGRRPRQLREPAVEPFDRRVENVGQDGARHPALPRQVSHLRIRQAAGGVVLHTVDSVVIEAIDTKDLDRDRGGHRDGRESRRNFVR